MRMFAKLNPATKEFASFVLDIFLQKMGIFVLLFVDEEVANLYQLDSIWCFSPMNSLPPPSAGPAKRTSIRQCCLLTVHVCRFVLSPEIYLWPLNFLPPDSADRLHSCVSPAPLSSSSLSFLSH